MIKMTDFVRNSIVVPALDEAENLPMLIDQIRSALGEEAFEIIVIDDGSTDSTGETVNAMARDDQRIRLVSHKRNLGQSGAVRSGVENARGAQVATLDGDGQNDPEFLLALLAPLAHAKIGLVAGQRLGRQDTWSKKIGSKIANFVRSRMLGDSTRDAACGMKAFRRADFLTLPYFDTMHRFLPALYLADGWEIAHVEVVDRPRMQGKSKYTNFGRLLVGVPDLFGVWWLCRRRRNFPSRQGKVDTATGAGQA